MLFCFVALKVNGNALGVVVLVAFSDGVRLVGRRHHGVVALLRISRIPIYRNLRGCSDSKGRSVNRAKDGLTVELKLSL